VGTKFGADGVTIAGGQAGMPEGECNLFKATNQMEQQQWRRPAMLVNEEKRE
jgi:hypothetical protein